MCLVRIWSFFAVQRRGVRAEVAPPGSPRRRAKWHLVSLCATHLLLRCSEAALCRIRAPSDSFNVRTNKHMVRQFLNSWLQNLMFIAQEIIKNNPNIKELRPGTMKNRLEIARPPQGQDMSQNWFNWANPWDPVYSILSSPPLRMFGSSYFGLRHLRQSVVLLNSPNIRGNDAVPLKPHCDGHHGCNLLECPPVKCALASRQIPRHYWEPLGWGRFVVVRVRLQAVALRSTSAVLHHAC